MPNFMISPTTEADRNWIEQFTKDHWGASSVVVHGTTYFPYELPGFIALEDGEVVGLVTYRIEDDNCEIVTINSVEPGMGIGTALLDAVKQKAVECGCSRLWLITTNDNFDALGFYQKRGFVLVKIYRDAVTKARKQKPEIPLYGNDSIPIRDEIELEMLL